MKEGQKNVTYYGRNKTTEFKWLKKKHHIKNINLKFGTYE